MINYLGSFMALPLRRKILLAEAVMSVFIAKLLLKVIPVKSVIRISLQREKVALNVGQHVLTDIKNAINHADRLSFWKNRCLVKSIAGRWMLQRRGITSNLSFGVKLDEKKKISAHAWLTAGGFEVVEKGSDYLELSVF